MADGDISGPSSGSSKVRIIFGTTIGNLLGINCTVCSVFGLLLVPISQEFGWSRTAVAGAFTAISLANAVALPIAGRATDRWGARPVLILGYLLLGLAILALAMIRPNPVCFYLLFTLTGAIGSLPSSMALAKLLSEWFDEGRGFWLGLTDGVGNGVGSMLMPLIAAFLMTRYGFRTAFTGIGLIVLLVGLPVAWFTLRAPSGLIATGAPEDELLAGLSVGETLRRPLFWLIFSAVPIAGGSLTAVFANTVPIMESRGLSLSQTMTIVSIFSLICVIWQPLVGFFLDRSDRPRNVAPFYAMAAVGLVMLMKAHGFVPLAVAGALTGIGLGAEFSVMPFVLSRYFGLRSMGTIVGISFVGVLVANALIPVVLNFAYDRTGSYAPALALVTAMLVYNMVVFLCLGRYPNRFSNPHPQGSASGSLHPAYSAR